jgi:polyisoprenyl-phosphate glycosyltransferase
MTHSAPKRVCLIVPCFNEQDVLPEFFQRIDTLAASLPGYTLEVVYVDDGSRDDTAALLRMRAAEDPRNRVILLSRNFGHQAAITAGLDHCDADMAVIVDADLQDPPELVQPIVEQIEQGADVVHMVRAARPGDSASKRWSARLFYWYMARWGLQTLPQDAGDFKGLSHRAVQALRGYPERIRFLRGLIVELGFNAVQLEYIRDPRHAGTSKYPANKVVRFAMDATLSHSPLPMWIVLGAGAVSAAAAFPLLGVVGLNATGLLAFLVLLYSGLVLMALGLVGEYLVRILIEVKQRPLYFVKERLNVPDGAPRPWTGDGASSSPADRLHGNRS